MKKYLRTDCVGLSEALLNRSASSAQGQPGENVIILAIIIDAEISKHPMTPCAIRRVHSASLATRLKSDSSMHQPMSCLSNNWSTTNTDPKLESSIRGMNHQEA